MEYSVQHNVPDIRVKWEKSKVVDIMWKSSKRSVCFPEIRDVP